MRIVLVIAITILLVHSLNPDVANGQNSKQKKISAADEQLIDELFIDFGGNRPGAVVMIAKNDQLLFGKSYGLANLETKTPTTMDTNFRIGSVSKQFTAMAVLKLIDQRRLRLDTKLTEVFPDFPDYGNKVAIYHMLTHQSGLPDYGPLARETVGRQLAGKDVVKYLKTLDKLDFEPESQFQYSNTAFAVLGEVVAQVSGIEFAKFMEQEIFVPAGMKETKYGTSLDEINNRALGYHISAAGVQPRDQSTSSAIEGDGSIYISANDFFRWHLALHHQRIVSPELHQRAYQPQKGTNGRYGFGWFMPETKTGSFVQHGGSTAGFLTYSARIPEQGITVAILTNRGWSRDNLPTQNIAARAEALLSIATERSFPMPSKEGLDDMNAWIRTTVEMRMKQNNIPAVSIGIIRGGKLKLVDGYGSLKRDGEQNVDENTIFQIASTSKMFAGMIVSDLVDSGKLILDEPIVNYLGDAINEDAKAELADVKLKHIIQNTSGIPHRACSINRNTNHPAHAHWTVGYSKADLIADINKIKLEFEPGTKWGYSSSGYAILGHICEIVTEASYESLLKKHATLKFGLADTAINLSESQQARLATPYDPQNRDAEGKVVDWGMANPPSGIFSSASDMTQLMKSQIEAYQRFEKTGERSSLILTDHPDTDNRPRTKGETHSHFCLGFFKWVTPNGVNYGIPGDNDGFAIYYEINPDDGHGHVLMTSSGGRWFGELGKEILAKLNGQPYVDPSTKKSLAQSVYDIAIAQGMDAAINQFREHKDSDKFYFREDEMNNAGYALMQQNKVKEAIEVFRINVKEFPDSWNVYDSLGEAYLRDGNEELGIKNYQMSIKLNPENTPAIEILKKLDQARKSTTDD